MICRAFVVRWGGKSYAHYVEMELVGTASFVALTAAVHASALLTADGADQSRQVPMG